MVAIGSDHGALELKSRVKIYLEVRGMEYQDFGTYTPDSCDYPEYAHAVAKAVASGECEFGVLCCTTGIGMSIAANKVPGARAGLCTSEHMAEMTRLHNDANILCLGATNQDLPTAMKILEKFIDTPFSGEERHMRRISKIEDI